MCRRSRSKKLLAKGDTLFAATKQVLGLYGLAVDDWLDTVKVRTVSQTAEKATVAASFEFLGSSEESEIELLWRDGHWVHAEVDVEELASSSF